MPLPTPQPAHLDALARVALGLAQAAGYSVYVEAAGQRMRLGPAGAPGRDLVIALGPPAAVRPAHDDTAS